MSFDLGWSTSTLDNAADFINGDRGKNYPSSSDYVANGIPFVSASDLDGRRIDLSGATFISQGAYDRLGSGKIEQGDILFCLRGSLGKIGLAMGIQKGAIASSLVIIRPKQNTTRDFLYYILSGSTGKTIARELDNGSVQGNLSVRELKQVEIDLPPFNEQKAIAHILGTLDDKIELNRKTNETLEAMAKSLFKSWFVDFDPVRAKAEGRHTGLPAEISDLFPDSFEDSELGEVPSGWSVGEIDQIVNLRKDSLDPASAPDEIFDHYSIPAFDAGKYPARELGSSIKSQKFLVGDGDLLVSKLNPSTPRVWIPFASSGSRAICSTEFLVCRTSSVFGRAYAYCLASSDAIVEAMTGLAGGTSNSHQRIRPRDFLALPCCMGTEMVRSAFLDVVEPLLGKSLALRNESKSLSTTRDSLLPKLISGEIRIPDAEKMLEEFGI